MRISYGFGNAYIQLSKGQREGRGWAGCTYCCLEEVAGEPAGSGTERLSSATQAGSIQVLCRVLA